MRDHDNPYSPPANVANEPRASRTRFVVLAFLCGMAFILYLDRICFGQAATMIQKDLEIPLNRMGWVHAAFTVAYGLFEVFVGHWGDRFGSRRVLTRIVVWWSLFTSLTAQCVGFWSLVTVRFLFGAGEAGALPNAARIIRRWFAPVERGRAQGFFSAATLLGGAFAPVMTALLIAECGWRWTFVIYGGLGVAWSLVFFVWFRDDPAEHSAVNEAELRWLSASGVESAQASNANIPWRTVFRNRTIWLLGLSTTCSSFNTYLYFSWFPTYLKKAREVAEQESGWLTGMVLVGGIIGNLLGGWLLDRYVLRSERRTIARRWLSCTAFAIAACGPMLAIQFDQPFWTALCCAVSCTGIMVQQTNWWSSATEVSGKYLGALFGLMNGLGVIGATASQLFVGWFASWRTNLNYQGRDAWDPIFYIYGCVLLVGLTCWLLIDPSQSVRESET